MLSTPLLRFLLDKANKQRKYVLVRKGNLLPLPETSAEDLAPARDVEFLEMPVKQILNRCTSPWMRFRWTINPYRGCEFGCVYCYARYTHEFLELRDPMDFERKIFVKRMAAEVLS